MIFYNNISSNLKKSRLRRENDDVIICLNHPPTPSPYYHHRVIIGSDHPPTPTPYNHHFGSKNSPPSGRFWIIIHKVSALSILQKETSKKNASRASRRFSILPGGKNTSEAIPETTDEDDLQGASKILTHLKLENSKL